MRQMKQETIASERQLELSAQRNETEIKQFQNCFKTVFVSASFRSADSLIQILARFDIRKDLT